MLHRRVITKAVEVYMSLDQIAITPVANIPDISATELESIAQATDIDPAIPAQRVEDPKIVETMMNSLERSSAEIPLNSVEQTSESIKTLSPTEGIAQSVFHVGADQAPVSVFDQAMANFKSATNHAIEVSIISTAGSSMAGSMSKLMSGS